MMDQDVLDETMFFGIYHDDGLAVFPRVRTQADVEHWLSTFQGAINNEAGNDKLSFTAEVWTTGARRRHNDGRRESRYRGS
jgi:hypothetical protein